MKQNSLFTFMVAAMFLFDGQLMSQDTLRQNRPSYNYYVDHWLDTRHGLFWGYGYGMEQCDAFARMMYHRGELTVYGIAASMATPHFYEIPEDQLARMYADTSMEECAESLRLYQYSGGAMRQQGEDLTVHALNTPVSYYQDFCTYRPEVMTPLPVFPVYERYFQKSQNVHDTFYIGTTQRWDDPMDGPITCLNFSLLSLTPGNVEVLEEDLARHIRWFDEDGNVVHAEWLFTSYGPSFLYIFPILTPNPDTNSTGDTLGMQTADLVSRYVSVMPNPAHESAEVLSSFGLTKIELYDEQGRLLRTLAATGLRATLDLHSLPPSTYLLRIHTPAGTTTKKLLVR